MNEIGNTEKLILSKIDLEKGPDNIQINLAIKLNIFKIFSLKVRKKRQANIRTFFSKGNGLVLFERERISWSIPSVSKTFLISNNTNHEGQILFKK